MTRGVTVILGPRPMSHKEEVTLCAFATRFNWGGERIYSNSWFCSIVAVAVTGRSRVRGATTVAGAAAEEVILPLPPIRDEPLQLQRRRCWRMWWRRGRRRRRRGWGRRRRRRQQRRK